MRRLVALFLGLLVAGCSSGATTVAPTPRASPVPGALRQGLIAFHSTQGLSVLDPASGKQFLVVPLAAQPAFRVVGPVWGPSGSSHGQALYFTLHDSRPPETSRAQGVVAYDWVFRADPFTGALEPLAAATDATTEGPVALAASSRELAFTAGCCGDYDVNLLRFGTAPVAPVTVARPAGTPGLFVQGASPVTNWLVIRTSDGAWEWLDPETSGAQGFPLPLKAADGPVAVSNENQLAVVSGGGIQVADLRSKGELKAVAGVSGQITSVAWKHDSSQLAVALNGGVTVAEPAAGAAPTALLPPAGVTTLDWSEALPTVSADSLKQAPSPQAAVDALLAATRLPAADDTVSSRARTKVYLWQIDLKQAGAAASELASVSEVTPDFLQAHPPLAATVLWHHWSATGWLLGGCYRYRAVVQGPTSSVASTLTLGDPTTC